MRRSLKAHIVNQQPRAKKIASSNGTKTIRDPKPKYKDQDCFSDFNINMKNSKSVRPDATYEMRFDYDEEEVEIRRTK